MKKSNRYATRYTAKKKDLERLGNYLELELAKATSLIRQLQADLSRKPKTLDDPSQGGYAVIRIGKDNHMSGDIIGISVHVSVSELKYRLYMCRDHYNLSNEVKIYCRMLEEKIRAGLMEYLVEGKIL